MEGCGLASVGRLAAGVAYEIRNPLTGIASLAQNLREETDLQAIQERIALIQQQTRRIADIVQSLVTFAHGGLSSERPVELVGLTACVEEAVRLVRLSHAGKQIAYVNRCDAAVRLVGDPNRLVQVFVNLLSNACDASRPGDTVEVRSTFENDFVSIEVVDEGGSIAPELHETFGGGGDHGLSAPAQAAREGYFDGSPMERVSPATSVYLGGRLGAVRPFGPLDGPEMASVG